MPFFGFGESDNRKETKKILKAVRGGKAEISGVNLRSLDIRSQKEMDTVKRSLERKDRIKKLMKKRRKKRKPGVSPGRGTSAA